MVKRNDPTIDEEALRQQRRAGIYASEETKRKLLDVVQLLGRGNLSLTAYVDNILRHHLEFYREEINRLHKQRNSQNIL